MTSTIECTSAIGHGLWTRIDRLLCVVRRERRFGCCALTSKAFVAQNGEGEEAEQLANAENPFLIEQCAVPVPFTPTTTRGGKPHLLPLLSRAVTRPSAACHAAASCSAIFLAIHKFSRQPTFTMVATTARRRKIIETCTVSCGVSGPRVTRWLRSEEPSTGDVLVRRIRGAEECRPAASNISLLPRAIFLVNESALPLQPPRRLTLRLKRELQQQKDDDQSCKHRLERHRDNSRRKGSATEHGSARGDEQ